MSIIFAMSAKFSLRDNSIAKHVPTKMVVTGVTHYVVTFKKNSLNPGPYEFHEKGGFSLKGMINVQ